MTPYEALGLFDAVICIVCIIAALRIGRGGNYAKGAYFMAWAVYFEVLALHFSTG